LYIDNIIGLQ